ncbi:DUF6608 family protein [Dethiobacter alkaliphilus]|uniref:Uncharacterized protein n=1 Tax=Dethiobacter alkaliphilus AHT 1 TaxID=555088 RepID=C0GFJ8_DETAL|nr:DUF6608 family protein [Dethiobacter alkaliphilus]EEG77958.1 conserved hypothetical protein [Dethiobacter alkaliphilus AHT 1]
MRVKLDVKSALILICVVYTLLTITSSGFAMLAGRTTDTHAHLLMRFVVTAIGIGSILIFNLFPKWSLPAIYAFHYGVTMGVILLLMWISGFFIELHPDAYRDIFFNFTPIYILISAGLILFGRMRRPQKV